MQVRSVTAVTQYIKMLLEADDELDDLWIEGEVSNFTRASSGHCYFTLKDSDCELRCVMWRGQAARLGWRPVAGDGVLAHGYISVYERGGAYQFYVDEIRRGGVGLWWQRFEEVRRRLEAEGLFDPARKRPLPRWPRRIGVVTSPTGAALQDILNVLRARYPLVEVVLSPCMVQGVDAPPSLVRAIERLGEEPEIDVVILARGGGSMEDLWAFNDEAVARAVAACPVPVVTGVGHETDFTIVDFVSDLRTPTPSAAAAAVVPDARELRQQIDMMAQALTDIIIEQIVRRREALDRDKRLLRLHDPRRILHERRQRIDEMVHRARTAVQHRLAVQRIRLERSLAGLQALNPAMVLERGYAVLVDDETGRRIRSVDQAFPGQTVSITLRDGDLGGRITRVAQGQRQE
ncbi:MAG TPA: exodeoxyribonuclease VII large subunit [Chloroflexi bacterium]|jgi:exodeoxyribonuclease VII large subunit|nr:exodeoxyribonuclease VII large subunit [Chloroflexota bacterium]